MSNIALAFLLTLIAGLSTGIGGIIGAILGTMLTLLGGKFILKFTEPLWPPVPIALGALVFSVALGIIFGMYPAIKASGLQPVEALRAE